MGGVSVRGIQHLTTEWTHLENPIRQTVFCADHEIHQ